jgi:hypothetical protein
LGGWRREGKHHLGCLEKRRELEKHHLNRVPGEENRTTDKRIREVLARVTGKKK